MTKKDGNTHDSPAHTRGVLVVSKGKRKTAYVGYSFDEIVTIEKGKED